MNNQPNLDVSERRDIGECLSFSFEYLKTYWKTIFTSVLFVLPLLLIAAALMPTVSSMQESMTDLMAAGNSYEYGKFMSKYILGILMVFIATIAISSFVIVHMKRHASGESLNTPDVWGELKSVFLSLLGGSILLGLLVTIGFILCIIPGIFVAISCFFVLFVIVNEKMGAVDSLKRSYELVKQNWWVTFAYIIIVLIATFAVNGLLSTLSILVSLGVIQNPIAVYIVTFFGYAVSLLLACISYVLYGAWYYSLREQESGLSEKSQIDSIGRNNDLA